jgi:thiol-disulfide isomerase/thioredoxin
MSSSRCLLRGSLRPLRLILFLLVPAAALASQNDTSPSAAYKALAKEFDDALAAYQKAYQAARTPEEKQKVVKEKHPPVADFATKFMALARQHAGTAAAADALVWVVTHPLDAAQPEAKLRDEALGLLGKHHADSDAVGSLCTQLVLLVDPATEKFLRAVREKAKKVPVKARAVASLAVNLRHRARTIAALGKNADARKQYEAALGKKAIAALLEQEPKELRGESEKLFEEVNEKYGDLPHPTHDKLGLFARRNLQAMRSPADVDRVAPPMSGEDSDGKKLTLAQFKGQVVLVDFWSDAFEPCRAMYDYERGLVKRLAGKPFVLLGVNGDMDRDELKKVVAREKMTWRSIWDRATGGPIATRWDVEVWPTVLLIDHKGVIRHSFVGWPETKKLDQLIDTLVREALKNP